MADDKAGAAAAAAAPAESGRPRLGPGGGGPSLRPGGGRPSLRPGGGSGSGGGFAPRGGVESLRSSGPAVEEKEPARPPTTNTELDNSWTIW